MTQSCNQLIAKERSSQVSRDNFGPTIRPLRKSRLPVVPIVAAALMVASFPQEGSAQALAAGPEPPALVVPGSCLFGATDLKRLGFAEMVARVLCNSGEYRRAWEAVQEKAAAIGVQRAELLPIVTGSLSDAYLHRWTVTAVPFFNANMRYSLPTWSGTVKVPIYDFGKSLADLRRARSLFVEAEAGRGETLIQVVVKAAETYYAAVTANAEAAGAEEALRLADQTDQMAQARESGGVGSLSDRLRARSVMLKAEIAYLQAKATARQKSGDVAVSMGLPPDTGVTFAPAAAADSNAPRGICSGMSEIRTLLMTAQRNDPELKAGEAEVSADEEAIRSARSAMLPSLELSIGYQNFDQRFLGLDNIFGLNQIPADNRIRSLSAELEISVPLFDGMANLNRMREAEAREREARASLKDTRRRVIQDVWDDDVAYRVSCCLGERPAIQYVNVSRQAAQSALARYKAGVAEVTEPLDAVRVLSEARTSEAKMVSECAVDVVRLSADLGTVGY